MLVYVCTKFQFTFLNEILSKVTSKRKQLSFVLSRSHLCLNRTFKVTVGVLWFNPSFVDNRFFWRVQKRKIIASGCSLCPSLFMLSSPYWNDAALSRVNARRSLDFARANNLIEFGFLVCSLVRMTNGCVMSCKCARKPKCETVIAIWMNHCKSSQRPVRFEVRLELALPRNQQRGWISRRKTTCRSRCRSFPR